MSDSISRQAVLEIAKSSKSNWIDNSVLFKRVNELPPVNPQPKTGHWIKTSYNMYGPIFKCSVCNHNLNLMARSIEYNDYNCDYDHCPFCKSRMESGEQR